MTDFLADLAQQAPNLRLTTAPGDLEFYGRDWTRRWTPAPMAVAFPATIEDVQAIARWASAHRVALVPSGGRTGLSGGAVARVTASPLEALVTTDSIAATEAVRVARNIRRLTIAPLIAEAIRRISEERSVSSLFD